MSELPEPTATIRRWTTNSISVDIPPQLMDSLADGERLYTTDQVHALIRRENERCAKMAEDMESLAGAIVHDIARAIREDTP
jgi:hypothetical protein